MSTKEHEEVNQVGHTLQKKKKEKKSMPNSLLQLDTSVFYQPNHQTRNVTSLLFYITDVTQPGGGFKENVKFKDATGCKDDLLL